MWIVSVLFQEIRQVLSDLVEILWDRVRQVAILGLRPNEFDGVKFGSVTWQPARLKPRAALLPQMFGGGAMGVQAIPDQEHRATEAVVDCAEEAFSKSEAWQL